MISGRDPSCTQSPCGYIVAEDNIGGKHTVLSSTHTVNSCHVLEQIEQGLPYRYTKPEDGKTHHYHQPIHSYSIHDDTRQVVRKAPTCLDLFTPLYIKLMESFYAQAITDFVQILPGIDNTLRFFQRSRVKQYTVQYSVVVYVSPTPTGRSGYAREGFDAFRFFC